jgi:hypothetical protein
MTIFRALIPGDVMRRFCTVVVALTVVSAGCDTRAHVGAATRELLETDRAWAELVDANGPVGSIVGYWTSDARVVLTGQPVVVGSEAMRTMIAESQNIPGLLRPIRPAHSARLKDDTSQCGAKTPGATKSLSA